MSSPERFLGVGSARLAKAVRLGNIWIDVGKLEEILHRYVKHLFAMNDDDKFPYSFPGSGSAIRIGGRHFLFCCGHQIETWTPDQIAFCIFKSDTIISSSSMFHPILNDNNVGSDYVDARAFEYTIEKYNYDNLESEFFPADRRRIWPDFAIKAPFLVYGYPCCLQDVDYSAPKIAARAVEIKATYDGGTSSPYLHRIKMLHDQEFDADGMSGGPVFYIGRENGSFFIGWAGIVMRGSSSSGFLHFLSANFLIEMTFHHPIDEVIVLNKIHNN